RAVDQKWSPPAAKPLKLAECRSMISKVTKLLIATTNAGKLREVEPLLDRLPIDLLTLADVSRIPPPEESGATFAENARAKALYYANATGHPTVAEDSGLEIDALGGAPGVHSARYGGERSSYPEKFRLIEEALRASGTTDRRARFVCALALANSRGVRFESRG